MTTTAVPKPAPATAAPPAAAPAAAAQPPKKKTLTFVKPEAREPKLNVLLYGPPKRGKTVGAASAPGPILYLNPEPSTALDFARRRFGSEKIWEFPITGKQSLIDASLFLRDGAEGAQTVVLDTVGDTWRILVEEISSEKERASLQQYGDVGTIVERFCRFLCKDIPQNVVLVCHEQAMETGDGNVLMPMTGGKKNPMILCAMVDVIGYVAVMPEDKGDRYVAQVVPGQNRYAGNRNGILGRVADLDLTEWCETYRQFNLPQK